MVVVQVRTRELVKLEAGVEDGGRSPPMLWVGLDAPG
jgi:hypothetical protein